MANCVRGVGLGMGRGQTFFVIQMMVKALLAKSMLIACKWARHPMSQAPSPLAPARPRPIPAQPSQTSQGGIAQPPPRAPGRPRKSRDARSYHVFLGQRLQQVFPGSRTPQEAKTFPRAPPKQPQDTPVDPRTSQDNKHQHILGHRPPPRQKGTPLDSAFHTFQACSRL